MTDEGVQFPQIDGRRSTSSTAREVLAAAARSVSPELATAIESEREWRTRYIDHLRSLVEVGARSAKNELAIATEGLAALHERFVFARGGSEQPLREALRSGAGAPLATITVDGSGTREPGLSVPYRGSVLRGDTLLRQLDDWVARGVVEPGFADAIRLVLDNPDWLDLGDTTVALLGAGSQMGPYAPLTRWGAHVAALDVPGRDLWGRLLSVAGAGSGRVSVPVPADASGTPQSDAGVDLLTQTPEALEWLAGLPGPLVVGNYVYADAATFVRLSMAVDAIVAELLDRRSDVAAAYLATPTDVFAVPPEVVAGARAHWEKRGWRAPLQAPVRAISRSKTYVPHYRTTVADEDGRELGIADSLVAQQGPNSALAKRLQRWRAAVTREAGVLTSANVAPATRTTSVLKNPVLAAAYRGAGRFGVEIFEPETSATLMAALLVHDLRNPAAAGAPGSPVVHPLDVLAENAAHGGLWRAAYEPRSVLPIAAAIGFVDRRR